MPPDPPAPPPPPRRALVGWATALAALAVSTLLLAAGLWAVRFSIAEFLLGAALAERGVEAEFQVVNLDFDGITLSGVRFGSPTAPDAEAPTIEAGWRWAGLLPRLTRVEVRQPRLRLRMDSAGRVSAGSLDRLGSGRPARQRASIPAIELALAEGELLLEGPFGVLTGTFSGDGALGQDFSANAQLAPASLAEGGYTLEAVRADLIVVSREGAIAFRLSADAESVAWETLRVEGASFRAMGRAPLDLSRIDVETAWRASALSSESMEAQILSGAAGFEALTEERSLDLRDWEGEARVSAAQIRFGDASAERPRFDAHARGDGPQGAARWTLSAVRFAGFTLISDQPSAAGEIAFELTGDETLTGDATLTLARTRLNDGAQQDVRAAFPDLGGAPVGPTFAAAERALDRAADRFDLTIPLRIAAAESGVRVFMDAAAEARSATGAQLRFAPLRSDAPALIVQWPGPTLHGAAALELRGGSAPYATLLLDAINWSPETSFEADGTLTLADWRAEAASIAADELGISISTAPAGGGVVSLRGPARVTGPLGDGQVRDLAATLDIAIHWGGGWRVVPNGCLPMSAGAIDAAGLSFANGAFALCPLNGALIAADAQRNLSGGFIVRRLGLNGRMAGGGQPVRLDAEDVIGRFRGRTGDMVLALEAARPGLAIEMADARTLRVVLQRMTADARIADSWSVTGAFERGVLTDPALPGSVSTITGGWSAAPGDDGPVIQVSAGEATLTANRPATDAERPLFNPLRLVNVTGVLRGGRIDAHGGVLLEERARQLAEFTAEHVVREGRGMAQVSADRLVFGPQLQPYEITERARGMIDNVRGSIGLRAAIIWTHDRIDGAGRVRLDGLSLSTSTIPIIENVRGEVYFDNLFELTTPPGQRIEVGLVNPGIAARNGRVRFQLLDDQQVSIEGAEFDFAGGTLSMAPTTIVLGADETGFRLTLTDVEAGTLLDTLNVPDLDATGRLEGAFPLILTRRTSIIDNGVLRALPGGGTIAYTGDAGANASGPVDIAFDALRRFEYDELSLTLNGDINDEVITDIEFSGRNTGEAVDLGEISSIPGVGSVRLRGVPFVFNVRVTAPFRRLAQTAATIADPISVIDRSELETPAETDEPVDQPPPEAR